MKKLLFLLIASACIAQVPRGMIIAYGGAAAPNGWLLCDGSEKMTSQYPGLSALLGTRFGTASAGKFKLPDLRGRVIAGAGNGAGLTPRAAGTTFGAENVLLAADMIPPHRHAVNITSGTNVNRGQCCVSNPNNGDYGGGQALHQHQVTGQTESAGAWGNPTAPVPTTQPSLAISYIIKI